MPEIYLKKNVYWIDRKRNTERNIIIAALVVIILVLTILSLSRKESKLEESKPKVDKVNLTEKKNSRKTTNYQTPKVLLCQPFEEEFYNKQNNARFAMLLFSKCDSSEESREIETYYNYHFNGKLLEFKYQYEFSDEIKRIKNLYCFTGGKAQIALNSEYFPKCVEFEDINLNNFSLTNLKDPNIYIKVYIYKVSNNKIHLLALQKKIIKESFIKNFINLEGSSKVTNESVIGYTLGDNKYLRICDLLQDIDFNQVWFEIAWNPQIQNMLCFKKFKYIN